MRSPSGGGESRLRSARAAGLARLSPSTPSTRASAACRAFEVGRVSSAERTLISAGSASSSRSGADVAMRSSSACRSGLGSSRFSGSVNIDSSGSGGHLREVRGRRGAGGAASAAGVGAGTASASGACEVEAAESGSREGAGADAPAKVATHAPSEWSAISKTGLSRPTLVCLVAGD